MQTAINRLIHLPRIYLVAIAVVILLAGLELGLHFGQSSNSHSDTVTLSRSDDGTVTDIASGSLAGMVAKASNLSGFDVQLPSYMPPKSYISSITLESAANRKPDESGPVALIDIHVPSGQYLLEELKGQFRGGLEDTSHGLTVSDGAWIPAALPGIQGDEVYLIPNHRQLGTKQQNTGYAVVGKTRTYTLQATTPHAYDSAATDIPKMIASIPMD